MAECYKCGISKEKTTLYEGISPAGIINVCRKCYFKQKLPLLDHKKVDWAEVDHIKTVRERLNLMSGFKENPIKESHNTTQKDQELKQLVERNFQENSIVSSEIPTDLITNFNWVIMRKRRALKLSLKDFANRIYIPESIADSLERGILPRDYKGLIRKVENSLDINLFSEKKFKIRPEDLAVEAKVPSGARASEIEQVYASKEENIFYNKNSEKKLDTVSKNLINSVKQENKFTDNYEVDANELNLENVEDMFGIPEKIIKDDKKENSKNENELLDENVRKFAWGN